MGVLFLKIPNGVICSVGWLVLFSLYFGLFVWGFFEFCFFFFWGGLGGRVVCGFLFVGVWFGHFKYTCGFPFNVKLKASS